MSVNTMPKYCFILQFKIDSEFIHTYHEFIVMVIDYLLPVLFLYSGSDGNVPIIVADSK